MDVVAGSGQRYTQTNKPEQATDGLANYYKQLQLQYRPARTSALGSGRPGTRGTDSWRDDTDKTFGTICL